MMTRKQSGVVAGAQARPIDRRLWDRFNVDVGHLIVEVNGTNVLRVDVLDESVSGIGLLMHDVSQIVVDAEVTLVCDGNPLKGSVVSVEPREDGLYRVGVEWKVDRPERAESGCNAHAE